jgi:hypothetical protein
MDIKSFKSRDIGKIKYMKIKEQFKTNSKISQIGEN